MKCLTPLLLLASFFLPAQPATAFGKAHDDYGKIAPDQQVSRRCKGMNTGKDNPLATMISRYREEIPRLMERDELPGLSVAVVDREGLLWAEGFGVTARNGGAPVTADTLFSLQSASKVVTATAVMAAAERGLVDLDRPITTYLPEFQVSSRFEPDAAAKITLRHLLGHKAGFTHEAPCGNNYDARCPSFSEHIASIRNTWLRYPVGERYSYSNLGFDLAGYILEVVSRKPFAAFVKETVLDPLGMERTSFNVDRVLQSRDRAIGHDAQSLDLPVSIPMMPAGGLYSSAREMARYLRFQLNEGKGEKGRVLGARMVRAMRKIPFPVSGQTEGYALGIDVEKRGGVSYINHGGGGFGFLSDLMWSPELGVGVVVLTNSVDHRLQNSLASRILDDTARLRGRSKRRTKPPIGEVRAKDAGRTSPAAKHVGNYIGRSNDLDLAIKDGALGIRTDGPFLPMVFAAGVTDEAWVERDSGSTGYRFMTSKDGRRYILRIKDGVAWDYNQGPGDPPGPSRPDWAKYVGVYSFQIHGKSAGQFQVAMKNGYLYLDDVRLAEYGPGLFFSADGEALDLRGTPPRWRNIALSRSSFPGLSEKGPVATPEQALDIETFRSLASEYVRATTGEAKSAIRRQLAVYETVPVRTLQDALRRGLVYSSRSAREALFPGETSDEFALTDGFAFEVEGSRHTYAVRLPPDYDPTKAYPLLFDPGHGDARSREERLRDGLTGDYLRILGSRPVIFARSNVLVEAAPDQAGFLDLLDRHGSAWFSARMDAAVRDLMRRFSVDPNRVYVVGVSQSAFFTWALITYTPWRWAAAFPGMGAPNDAKSRLGNCVRVPVYVLSAENDTVVPATYAREAATILGDLGGDVKYVEVKGGGHSSWIEYAPPGIDWMFGRERPPLSGRDSFVVTGPLPFQGAFVRVDGAAPSDSSDEPAPMGSITATIEGQTIRIDSKRIERLTLFLSDDLVSLDRPVTVFWNGNRVFDGILPRSFDVLLETLVERVDSARMFTAKLQVM